MTIEESFQERARVFKNPERRQVIRDDFPDIMGLSLKSSDSVLSVIQRQLAIFGTNVQDAGRIHIAYPHKHPELRKGHVNEATQVAQNFKMDMVRLAPDIDWILVDALYEKTDLARSEKHSCLHSLTGKHNFSVDPDLQKDFCPFLDSDQGQTEYFVMIDDFVEQGTTLANLMSYIEYNGGVVLASGVEGNIVYGSNHSLKQQSLLPPERQIMSEGRLPEMAEAFVRSANQFHFGRRKQKYDQETCVAMFDQALQKHGLSLRSLTNGECNKVLETVNSPFSGTGFSELVGVLNDKPLMSY